MIKALRPEQLEALSLMHNGCILNGDTGSGKSLTALAYYHTVVCGGTYGDPHTRYSTPRDLYIITPAKKRDSEEWMEELRPFFLFIGRPELNPGNVNVMVDSWNNIKKYQKIHGAFFIFDEHRAIGSGAWSKAFIDITRKNQWIVLSATPGDDWKDYIPIFIANGFFKNKTDFLSRHAVFSRYSTYPKIERYINTGILERYRRLITVPLETAKSTKQIHMEIQCDYNKELYRTVLVKRWDPYQNRPIRECGQFCYLQRRVVNSDPSRIDRFIDILANHPRLIVFYNFDYELDILRSALESIGYPCSEWNGHYHENILDGERWVYLVNYAAGAEAWNCITTDTMVFYSGNYSYRTMKQAAGRIDRFNTPYETLYYYHLLSKAPIDKSIAMAVSRKKKFNEKNYLKHLGISF